MATLARVRRDDSLVDALLERGAYADTGCTYHPRCLTCPFERCRYETTGGIPQLRSHANAAEARALKAAGLDVATIGERLGVQRRQVFRYLQGC